MIRVLIVDDHHLARAALQAEVTSVPTFTLVGEARSGEEALALCATLRPDVVVMDCQMPGMGGVAATRAIAQHYPQIAVVLVSTVVDDALQQQGAQAGAAQVVPKATIAQTLREVIEQAAQQRRSKSLGDA